MYSTGVTLPAQFRVFHAQCRERLVWVVAGDAGHLTIVYWQGVVRRGDGDIHCVFACGYAFAVAVGTEAGQGLDEVAGAGGGGAVAVGAGVVGVCAETEKRKGDDPCGTAWQ